VKTPAFTQTTKALKSKMSYSDVIIKTSILKIMRHDNTLEHQYNDV
jgi:hypothetical protein